MNISHDPVSSGSNLKSVKYPNAGLISCKANTHKFKLHLVGAKGVKNSPKTFPVKLFTPFCLCASQYDKLKILKTTAVMKKTSGHQTNVFKDKN